MGLKLEKEQRLSLRTCLEVSTYDIFKELGLGENFTIEGDPETSVYIGSGAVGGDRIRRIIVVTVGSDVERVIGQHKKVVGMFDQRYRFVLGKLVLVPRNFAAKLVLGLIQRWIPKTWVGLDLVGAQPDS